MLGLLDVGELGTDIDRGMLVSSLSAVGCWSFIAASYARYWSM